MGLALCHSIPRDVYVLVAILFYTVAFILEAIVLGSHSSNTAAGYFTIADGKRRVAFVAVHPALYDAADEETKICDPSAALLTRHCALFAETFHILNGLAVTSFIVCVLAVLASVFVITRISHTTTGMLARLVFAFCAPTAFQCAVVGVFFSRTVSHARDDVAAQLVAAGLLGAGEKVSFHRRYAANLTIAATALVASGFLLVLSRQLYAVFTREQLKKENIRQRDVTAMMKLHLVVDDWVRQKQILGSHARSVKLEMDIKEDGAAYRGGDEDGGVSSLLVAATPPPRGVASTESPCFSAVEREPAAAAAV